MQAVRFVVEGIDGAGKTMQCDRLQLGLTMKGYKVFSVVEPTKSALGERVRDRTLSPQLRLQLSTLDRWQLMQQLQGVSSRYDAVVSDRSFLSAAAYQATKKSEALKILYDQTRLFPMPDVIFYINLPPSVSMQRKPYDIGTLERLRHVHDCYGLVLGLARNLGARVVEIDGEENPTNITTQILTIANQVLTRAKRKV